MDERKSVQKNIQKQDQDQPQKYFRPRAKGRGFYTEEEDQVITDGADIDNIQKYQASVRSAFYLTTGRASREENHFICKCAFILKRTQLNKRQLLYMLADYGTLFSLQYQIYTGDHHFYLRLRKQHKKGIIACEDEAISAIPESEREKYRAILRKLQAKADIEYKKISDIQDELLDTLEIPNIEIPDLDVIFSGILENLPDYQSFFDPEIDLSDPGCQSIIVRGCDLLSKDKEFREQLVKGFRPYYAEKLDGQRVLSVLKEWLSDVELTEEQASGFISEVLAKYCERVKEFEDCENTVGQYRREYKVREVKNLKKRSRN